LYRMEVDQEHQEHQYHLLEDAYEEKHRGRKIYNGEVNLQFVSLALFLSEDHCYYDHH
jgi:hypothetical protein